MPPNENGYCYTRRERSARKTAEHFFAIKNYSQIAQASLPYIDCVEIDVSSTIKDTIETNTIIM